MHLQSGVQHVGSALMAIRGDYMPAKPQSYGPSRTYRTGTTIRSAVTLSGAINQCLADRMNQRTLLASRSSGPCGTRASGYTDRAPVPPYAVCSSRRRREQQHQRDRGSERASRIILPLARNTSQKPPGGSAAPRRLYATYNPRVLFFRANLLLASARWIIRGQPGRTGFL